MDQRLMLRVERVSSPVEKAIVANGGAVHWAESYDHIHGGLLSYRVVDLGPHISDEDLCLLEHGNTLLRVSPHTSKLPSDVGSVEIV